MSNYKKMLLWNALLIAVLSCETAVALPVDDAPPIATPNKPAKELPIPNFFSDEKIKGPFHQHLPSKTQEGGVVQRRFARVNKAVLFNQAGQPNGEGILPKIRFNLFPETNFIGQVTDVDSNPIMGLSNWGGRILNGVGGDFAISADLQGASISVYAGNDHVYNIFCHEKDNWICLVTRYDTSKSRITY